MAQINKYTGGNTVTVTLSGNCDYTSHANWFTRSSHSVLQGILDDKNNNTSTDFYYDTVLKTSTCSYNFKTVNNLWNTSTAATATTYATSVDAYITAKQYFTDSGSTVYGAYVVCNDYIRVTQKTNSIVTSIDSIDKYNIPNSFTVSTFPGNAPGGNITSMTLSTNTGLSESYIGVTSLLKDTLSHPKDERYKSTTLLQPAVKSLITSGSITSIGITAQTADGTVLSKNIPVISGIVEITGIYYAAGYVPTQNTSYFTGTIDYSAGTSNIYSVYATTSNNTQLNAKDVFDIYVEDYYSTGLDITNMFDIIWQGINTFSIAFNANYNKIYNHVEIILIEKSGYMINCNHMLDINIINTETPSTTPSTTPSVTPTETPSVTPTEPYPVIPIGALDDRCSAMWSPVNISETFNVNFPMYTGAKQGSRYCTYIKFISPVTGRLTINFDGSAANNNDTYGFLLNSSGTQLTSNDNGNTGTSDPRLTYASFVADDVYYIAIGPYSSSLSSGQVVGTLSFG